MKNLERLQSKQNIGAYIPDVKCQASQGGNRTDEDSPFHKKRFIYQGQGCILITLPQGAFF
jgi:hypothetical protein